MDYDGRFIMQKTVDWSLLNDGMTIPVSACALLKAWDESILKNAPFALPSTAMVNTDESTDVDMNHLDPLFTETARLIISKQQGSTSMIQRKFSIGYNRAERLMNQLEKAGVVGVAHGSRPRDVLIPDENSLENLLNSLL